jgi:putative tricarboxylic transport membrane protein
MHLNKSVVAGIILMVFSIVTLAFIIPTQIKTVEIYSQEMSPRFFPNLAMVILLILSVILIVTKLMIPQAEDDVKPFRRKELFQASGAIIVMGLCVFLIETIGYFLCTTGALVGLMLYLGSRNWKALIIAAIVLPIFIYLLFEKGLNLELPRGVLF